ncbi:transposase [Streptomyces sp. NPDC004051]
MIKTFADALMSAEADALCNAEYGQVSDERVNHHNGYRPREWDTPPASGRGYPQRGHGRARRPQAAVRQLLPAPAPRAPPPTCSGPPPFPASGGTPSVEKLAESLGVTQLSKSQVSSMAKHLDEQVAAFRNRPLDADPYFFVWVDALTQRVREGGRIVNVHALVAVGANADGHREILGLDVVTAEDGADRLAFLRSLVARGLSDVQLVASDTHAGPVDAIGAVLPGASWQRCRTLPHALNGRGRYPHREEPAEPGAEIGPAWRYPRPEAGGGWPPCCGPCSNRLTPTR